MRIWSLATTAIWLAWYCTDAAAKTQWWASTSNVWYVHRFVSLISSTFFRFWLHDPQMYGVSFSFCIYVCVCAYDLIGSLATTAIWLAWCNSKNALMNIDVCSMIVSKSMGKVNSVFSSKSSGFAAAAGEGKGWGWDEDEEDEDAEDEEEDAKRDRSPQRLGSQSMTKQSKLGSSVRCWKTLWYSVRKRHIQK